MPTQSISIENRNLSQAWSSQRIMSIDDVQVGDLWYRINLFDGSRSRLDVVKVGPKTITLEHPQPSPLAGNRERIWKTTARPTFDRYAEVWRQRDV